MDSPPEANRIPAAPSSSSPDDAFSSPRPLQESPLFTFLANLSPIKSAKAAARYLQRFSQTNLPIPLPVFTSPRVDLQRSTSFEKREEPDAAGSDVYAMSDTQLKPEVIACSQKEVQSCSLSGCIEDYLADPVEAADATNTSDVCLQQNSGKLEFGSSFAGHKENIPKACDSNDSNTKTTIQLCQTGEDLSSASMNQSTFFRADDNANSDLFLDPFSREQHEEQFINQEAGQHQRGIRRHLQFEATMACDQKTNEADDTVDLSLLNSLVNIESVRGVSIPSVVRETFVNVEDHQHESLPTATATSATSQSPKSVQYPCDSVYVTPFEQQATPCAVRILTSQVTDNTEESNQVNTKKNRKRAQNNSENEDCKRCNCKRSKCLKLYCECFAAGIYCLDTCACDNCFNKPEYEDTVQDTRQQIESRNPLAFAPRVVKYAANSPAKMVEEGNRATPSSARHKRGCNCKKSKCLKKYCECYQAGVGCSEGCRCEGCGNAYGKKEEPRYRGAHRLENLSRDQLDTLGSRNNCMAVERAYESSPTREELADLSHGTPLPYSQSREVASSASVNIRDGEKVPGAQSIHDGNLLLPPAHLNWGHSPADFTPKLHGRKATPGISFYDILKEGDTPEMLKNTSIPTETINASSPNQKQVSLPQTRLQELQSVSSQTFRSGRKFVLPAVPSFPPLTPYCKLKGGIHKTNDDHK